MPIIESSGSFEEIPTIQHELDFSLEFCPQIAKSERSFEEPVLDEPGEFSASKLYLKSKPSLRYLNSLHDEES